MPVYHVKLSYKTTVALLHSIHMFRLAFSSRNLKVLCVTRKFFLSKPSQTK